MKDITDSFAFKELELNPYSIQQAKSLDRYRLTKIERLDRILSDRFRASVGKIRRLYRSRGTFRCAET